MEQDKKETTLDNHVRDYHKHRAEQRRHDYFYQKTTPLSRLVKMAQRTK